MTSARQVAELTADELRKAVAHRYGQVAIRPADAFNFPVGRAFAEAVGYLPATLDRLPAAASGSFAGVTYLPTWTNLRRGVVVVDLGCGAGLDTLFAAESVGSEGHVHAIDLAEEMVALARSNAEAAGFGNVDVYCAPVEAMPLPDAIADVVIANGVFNLAAEKEKAISEAFRVLKAGGYLVGAEIVLLREIPPAERSTLDDWFR